MEQALKIHDHADDHDEAHMPRTEEVIDAFDHVLQSLDEILAITERAFAGDPQGAGS